MEYVKSKMSNENIFNVYTKVIRICKMQYDYRSERFYNIIIE